MLKWIILYLAAVALIVLFFMGASMCDQYRDDDIDTDPPLGI